MKNYIRIALVVALVANGVLLSLIFMQPATQPTPSGVSDPAVHAEPDPAPEKPPEKKSESRPPLKRLGLDPVRIELGPIEFPRPKQP